MNNGYLLHLPFPPSVNSYYGITCRGGAPRKYIKEKGKIYQKDVTEYVQKNDLALLANVPLKVHITMTPPDNRVHDIDNILKCLFDSLTYAKFWQDDSFVRELRMDYAPVQNKRGSVLLHVEAI